MNKASYFFFLALMLNILVSCESTPTQPSSESKVDEPNLPLLETFETNDLKWIEENTKHHYLEVDEGVYYIEARDSSKQTSTAPYIKDYLKELDENFSVKLSFNLLDRDAHFWSRAGLMITCASLEYRAFITNKGEIMVTEHDYNEEDEFIIFEDQIEPEWMDKTIELEILINELEGEVIINEYGYGDFELQSKSVDGIRIFTSELTAIEVYEFEVDNL